DRTGAAAGENREVGGPRQVNGTRPRGHGERDSRDAPAIARDLAHREGGHGIREQVAARRSHQPGQAGEPVGREHRQPRRSEGEVQDHRARAETRPQQRAHEQHGQRLQRHGHRSARQRDRDLGRDRNEGGAKQHGERAPTGERGSGHDGGLSLHQSISTLRATALPPPRHRVARPVVCFRSFKANKRVVRIRAPDAPIGCPRAIAPPFTFTRSQSQPRARPSASAWSELSLRGLSSFSIGVGPSFPGISTGTVSALKRHASIAATAFWWLASAKRSWSARDTPAFLAVYSARLPMWVFENESHSPSSIMPSTSWLLPALMPPRIP